MIERILKVYHGFERVIVLVLLGLLMLVVLYGTIGLLVMIVRAMIERAYDPQFQFAMPLLHEVFSGFLMILIGLELMKTIVMYLDEQVIHVEVVLSVAMIAIARHAIDVDYTHVPALSMIGIGVIIIALAGGYYFFKRADASKYHAFALPAVTPEVGQNPKKP
jgi:uncharacterized membrane protein (DUF373 family)